MDPAIYKDPNSISAHTHQNINVERLCASHATAMISLEEMMQKGDTPHSPLYLLVLLLGIPYYLLYNNLFLLPLFDLYLKTLIVLRKPKKWLPISYKKLIQWVAWIKIDPRLQGLRA